MTRKVKIPFWIHSCVRGSKELTCAALPFSLLISIPGVVNAKMIPFLTDPANFCSSADEEI